MAEILKYLLPGLTPAIAFLLILLFLPEKIEKWSALLWKLLSMMGGLFRSAHKNFLKHDIQGRVNDFSRRLRKQVPTLSREHVVIQWVDPSAARESFFANDRLVLRLRRDDPHDHNFVHGAYLFVSGALLRKPKRYLSPSQRDALDLFICTKLLEEEKPALVDFFLGEYLHPKTEDSKGKVSTLVDDYAIIDSGGFFFPLFVQELEYLGDKVFGHKVEHLVRSEVNGLIEFLKPVATKQIGIEADLNYDGNYCKFAIVIIGKPVKLLISIEPYVNYIDRELVQKDVETIYLLARRENRQDVEDIVGRFEKDYIAVRRVVFSRKLRYVDHSVLARQYLVVLRRKGIEIIQPSS